MGLGDYRILAFFFLACIRNISRIANIEKTQIFHKIKYDLKGHSRSHKMTFLFKIHFFDIFLFVFFTRLFIGEEGSFVSFRVMFSKLYSKQTRKIIKYKYTYLFSDRNYSGYENIF